MKKTVLLLILCFSTIKVVSQDTIASVENSTSGIQVGLGLWLYNEKKISNRFALRSEMGLPASFLRNSVTDETKFAFLLDVTIEPRWYYNLNRRKNKSKRIDGNCGNFVSIKTTYHPDVIVFSKVDIINFITDISFVPTWGIRRNIGKHFNYEAGLGFGYVHYFETSSPIDENDVAADIRLRVGYRF